MTSKKQAVVICVLVLTAMGIFTGVQSHEVPVVHAACTSLGANNFVWNINNVPHVATDTGDPGTRLQWNVSGTNFVGAIVKAKYETTEANAIWYCAKITGLNTLSNCANPLTDPPFPATVLTLAGVRNDPSTSPCPTATSDGTPCTAEVRYTLTFKPLDGAGIGARTLAQTYYWVDNSAVPSPHDFGDCQGEEEYEWVNFGPIYGSCSTNPLSSCYTVLFEEGP